MKVRIAQLGEGLHAFDFVKSPGQINIESHSAFPAEVRIHLELEKRNRYIAAHGTVQTAAHFQCDRCLDEFDRVIEEDFRIVFTFDPEFAAGEEAEDLVYIPAETEELDFTAEVRDALLLAVPMKVLCHEECRGLCPRCGANLNRERCRCLGDEIDPRWEALKRLLDSSS